MRTTILALALLVPWSQASAAAAGEIARRSTNKSEQNRLNGEGEAAMRTRELSIYPLLLLLCLCASPATAKSKWLYLEGNLVLERCEGADAYDIGFCRGAALAFSDAMEHQGTVCQPEGTDGQQVIDVLVNYLKAHPESRHRAAYELAEQAFPQVWPCSE